MAQRVTKRPPARRRSTLHAGATGYIFLPRDPYNPPALLQLPKTFEAFRKVLECSYIEPIRMPGWAMGIGLLGDEEARFSRDNSGLNPWLVGNGMQWDVRGPLLICLNNGYGPLNATEQAWCFANVVRKPHDA